MPRAATKKAAVKKAAPASELTVTPDGDVVNEPEAPDTSDWFTPLDDSTDWANVLLWGREGAGKTTSLARLANIAPEGSRVLIINAEGGLKRKALEKRGVDTTKLVMWPDPRKGQNLTRLGLETIYRSIQADLMRDPTSWFAVAWDSVSEIHQTVLDGVQRKRVRALERQGKDPDPDFVDRADYGTMSKMIRDLLRKYRDLPCHFFSTALERRDKDDETKKLVIGPSITPALQTDILGYVDMALYMKAGDEDGPFRAMTKGSKRFRVKDRFDILPRIMAEPMGDRIIGYLHGDLTEDADPFQDDLADSVKKSLDVKAAPVEEEEEDEETETSTE